MASNLDPEDFVGWLVAGLPSCVMVQAEREWGRGAHCCIGAVWRCVHRPCSRCEAGKAPKPVLPCADCWHTPGAHLPS